jgi:uncharacterized protein YbjT (DUF2867 family)
MVRKRRDSVREAPFGVEFVRADFDDPASLQRALEGIERAFLVTNSTEKVEAQQLRFVDLARAAGVRHIVYLSQLHADANSPVRFLRYHGVAEEAIRQSGIEFTHLRPNLYMQALLAFSRSIAAEGCFYAPAGDSRVSIVDVRDIAAVAAMSLTEPEHQGKIYDITGPEALTHATMATQLSEALGKVVTFVDIPSRLFGTR